MPFSWPPDVNRGCIEQFVESLLRLLVTLTAPIKVGQVPATDERFCCMGGSANTKSTDADGKSAKTVREGHERIYGGGFACPGSSVTASHNWPYVNLGRNSSRRLKSYPMRHIGQLASRSFGLFARLRQNAAAIRLSICSVSIRIQIWCSYPCCSIVRE